LLRLLDIATGMQSRVPRDLANRNISVKFSGLELNEGVRKIFQGQPLDYVVIDGQGIVVTAASQTITPSDSVPVYNAPPVPVEQPFVQDFGQPLPPQPGNQQQPAMIQTPFGPIANPRANQPPPQNVPVQGQQNPFLPGQQPMQPMQPGVPTPPFGAPSPFGTPAPATPVPAPAPNNNPLAPSPLFSNPGPTPLGAPGMQRTP
jgi:hypothetical protein